MQRTDRTTDPLIVEQAMGPILRDLVIAFSAYLGLRIGLAYLTPALFGGQVEGPPTSGWVVVAQRIVLCALTVLVVLGLLAKNGQTVATLGVRRDGVLRACLWGIVAYGTCVGVVYGAGWLAGIIWPESVDARIQGQAYNLRRLGRMNLAVTVVFSLATAICEELLFRGLLLTRLRGLTGSWTLAVLLSSVVFAALHVRQGWVPVALILGPSLLLGVWMAWRRHLLVTVTAHFLYDVTALVIMNW